MPCIAYRAWKISIFSNLSIFFYCTCGRYRCIVWWQLFPTGILAGFSSRHSTFAGPPKSNQLLCCSHMSQSQAQEESLPRLFETRASLHIRLALSTITSRLCEALHDLQLHKDCGPEGHSRRTSIVHCTLIQFCTHGVTREEFYCLRIETTLFFIS